MLNPYEVLANGIITQAANDYRQAVKFLKKHPRTDELVADAVAQRIEKQKRREERKKLNMPREREKRSKEERLLDTINENKRMVSETEKFFHSDWFSRLTNINRHWLLMRLKKEMEVE